MGKLALILFISIALISCNQNKPQPVQKKEEKKIPAIKEIQNDIAKIVKKVTPSVVTIFSYPKEKYEKTRIFNYFDESPQYNLLVLVLL